MREAVVQQEHGRAVAVLIPVDVDAVVPSQGRHAAKGNANRARRHAAARARLHA
jgi:hypothetical protein